MLPEQGNPDHDRPAPHSAARALLLARRLAGASSPAAFARVYLPELFHLGLPPFQAEILDEFGRVAGEAGGGRGVAAALPPGYGKSLLAALALPLGCIAYGLRRGIALVGADPPSAEKLVRAVAAELGRDERLRSDFPHLREVRERVERGGAPWLEIGRGAARVWTGARGRRVEGPRGQFSPRPDLIVLDAVETHAHQTAFGGPAATGEWWSARVRPLLDAGAAAAAVGGRLHGASLMAALLSPTAVKAGWLEGRCYGAVAAYPTCWSAWAAHELVHRGLQAWEGRTGPAAAEAMLSPETEAAMLEGGRALWPEREPLAMLLRRRVKTGWAEFSRVWQNRPPDLHELWTSPERGGGPRVYAWTDDMGVTRAGTTDRPEQALPFVDEPVPLPERAEPIAIRAGPPAPVWEL